MTLLRARSVMWAIPSWCCGLFDELDRVSAVERRTAGALDALGDEASEVAGDRSAVAVPVEVVDDETRPADHRVGEAGAVAVDRAVHGEEELPAGLDSVVHGVLDLGRVELR